MNDINRKLENVWKTFRDRPHHMTCTTGRDKDKGGYYIFQHIAPLVWAIKPVVRFAPPVRFTPLSPKPRAYRIIVTMNQRRETDTLCLCRVIGRICPLMPPPPPMAPHLTGGDNVSPYLQHSAAAAARPAIEATVS